MKKWLVIIGGVLLALLLLTVLILVFLPKPSSPNSAKGNPFADDTIVNTPANTQDVTPATVAANFYKWYLQHTDSDPQFPSTNQDKAAIATWVTPLFMSQWNSFIEQHDENPILLAQDTLPSWSSTVSSTVLTQQGDSSTVLVSLGSPSELNQLIVSLSLVGGKWLVSGVSNPPSP